MFINHIKAANTPIQHTIPHCSYSEPSILVYCTGINMKYAIKLITIVQLMHVDIYHAVLRLYVRMYL